VPKNNLEIPRRLSQENDDQFLFDCSLFRAAFAGLASAGAAEGKEVYTAKCSCRESHPLLRVRRRR
jgi:hypothetical protein